MDTKELVLQGLRENPGARFTPETLAEEINGGFILDITVNPQEVKKYCLELANERERVNHFTRTRSASVDIDGKKWTLYMDKGYLIDNVISECAPDRVDEVRDYTEKELREWITLELADSAEGSVIEHEFEYS